MIDKLTEKKIKEAASVVDVIGDFYQLRKKGTGFECLCPFHEDKEIGSFKISPSRNIYKCFSCEAEGGPIDFLMSHENLSYPDALRWLGKKYSIEVDEEQKKFVEVKPSKPKPLQAQASKELCTIPSEYVMHSLDTKLRSDFQAFLCRIINDAKMIQKVCLNYALGRTKDGGVIFWQIDEKGRTRSGKIMHYLWNGHRDKAKDGDITNWTHYKLKQQGKLPADWQLTQCLFGAHLLNPKYGNDGKTIGLVESEKSAVLCALAFPQVVWVACGGMGNLEAGGKHNVLKGRKVIMFPDTDPNGEAFKKWKQKADIWRKEGFDVTVSDLLERKASDIEKAEKIDIADWLVKDFQASYIPSPIEDLEPTRQEQILVEMIADNPAIGLLVERFQLEIAA